MVASEPSTRSADAPRPPRAFDAPGFAWLWFTSLFNAITWTVQALSLGWLVLELTDSPMWVGAVAAARGIGMFAFSLPAGTMATGWTGGGSWWSVT